MSKKRYSIDFSKIKEKSEYMAYKEVINEVGFYSVMNGKQKFKIYTAELMVILFLEKIEVKILSRNRKPIDTVIHGAIFQKTFFEYYRKGIEYFIDKFKISTNTIYGENSQKYVDNLHQNYFHLTDGNCYGKGWSFYKNSYPNVFSIEDIKNYGYYSGILDETDELISENPELFKDFRGCQSEVRKSKRKDQKTKEIITEYFEAMNSKGFDYAFKTEQDYNFLVDILTDHFEYNKYSLPKNTIKLKRGCKTKLAATLGKIHLELSNVDKFKSDTEYFEIVKCLNHFTNLSNDDLYKALTRNRKDY